MMAQPQDSQRPGTNGPPGSTGTTETSALTPIQQELATLKAQLDQARADSNLLDPDGTLSLAAIQARKTVLRLEPEYRALLTSSAKDATPSSGNPLKVYTDPTDGSTWYLDPQGNKVQLTGPKAAVDKPLTIPDDSHPGQTIAATPQEFAAYWNNKNTQERNQNSQDRTANSQDNAIARLTQANDLAQQRTDLGYYQADLDAKYKAGLISETQAMDLFKQKYDEMTYAQKQREDAFANQDTMLQSGIAAGNQAMDAAQRGTVNAVGPNFGADYASSLSAAGKGDVAGVHFGAGDFTTPMPNYAQLATQGAAVAIAHLSPYAASLVGQQGMPQYQGAGVVPAQPAVAASQYVPPNFEATASQPPTAMPIPPYQPVNRAVGANAQIQAGVR